MKNYDVTILIATPLENWLQLMGLLVVFIVVIIACWAVTRFVGGQQIKQKNMGNFQVIETYTLAKDRYLQLVKIGQKYYCISISKDSINTICEVPEEDVIKDIPKQNFQDIFKSINIQKKDYNKDLDKDKVDRE